MKRLLTLSLSACLSALFFASCTDDGPKEPGTGTGLYPLTIEASKATITPDSIDEVTLTVKHLNVVVTEGIELYVNDSLINPINFKFKTNVEGTYKFRAKKGNDNSPAISVVAKKAINRNPGTFIKNALTLYLTTTWCNNCPTAMDIIKSAQKDYPNRIVTLTWHSTQKGVIYDPFAVEHTQTIMIWLGGVGGFPMVNIDNQRALYPGSTDKREYEYSFYEAPHAGMVGVAIETKLNGRTVTGKVKVRNSSAELVKQVMSVNVVVTEDGLVANQIMPNGSANPSYVHEHVVRHVFTPMSSIDIPGQPSNNQLGEYIPDDKKAVDATYEYEFEYTIPSAGPDVPTEYNPANMNIAAFVVLGNAKATSPFIAAQQVRFGESIDFQYNKK